MNFDRTFLAITGDLVGELLGGLKHTSFAVSKTPLIAAFVFAFALSGVGQFYEIYLTCAEQLYAGRNSGFLNRAGLHSAIAILVMILLSATIYISNNSLGRHRIEQVFQEFNARLVDPRLERWVKAVGIFAAVLPWIGLVDGIRTALTIARRHIEVVGCEVHAVQADHPCAEWHFDAPFAVAPVDLHEQAGIYRWLEPVVGWLGMVPSFWGLVALLAGLVFVLLVRREQMRVLSPFPAALRGMLGQRAPARPTLLLPTGERGPIAVSRDALLRFRLVHGPDLKRMSGQLLIGAVALLTLGNLVVPFVVELQQTRFGNVPRADAGLGWLGWPGWKGLHAELRTLFGPALTPDDLGIWMLSVLALGVVLFALVTRLSPVRPRWIDKPVLALAVLAVPVMAGLVGLLVTSLVGRLAGGRWGLAGMGVVATVLFLPALLALIRRRQERRARFWMTLFYAVLAVLYLGAFAAAVLSGLIEFHWVDVARAFGPLAMSLLLMLIVLAIVISLCHVGRRSGFPLVFVLLGVGAVVVGNKAEWPLTWRIPMFLAAVGVAVALLSARRKFASLIAAGVALVSLLGQLKLTDAPGVSSNAGAGSGSDKPALITKRFIEWYDARKAHRAASASDTPASRYPVFIIAAEGGGIYAAAAAAAFLSRLQERCPAFAQHVFAVSGVSGGAIGSVVFHGAVDTRLGGLVREGCRGADSGRDPAESLQRQVAQVVTDDHLSPLAGLVVPDILGTFSDRAWGLTASLDQSMLAAFGTGDDLSRRARWAEPYLQHWAPTRAAPALVLNATWVRIGNRVVFAPFEIEPENLVTLNTFAGLHSTHKWRMPPAGISLADAAVTSARFPGVLAAFETRKAGNEDRRWSFVDGGYVDASGALTAQEIFRSLDEIKPRPDIDLRLILLTDAQANADEQGTKGAELRDLIAPVVALFRVRSLLSRIAVRETIAKIDRKSLDSIGRLAHPAQVDGSSDWKVMAVELNHDDFQLELGWKLSRLTYDIVSLQLGQADLCAKAKTRAKAPRGPQSRPLPAPAPIGMPEPSEPPPDSETQPTSPPAELPESERTEKEKRDKALEVAKTIRANSCVMASIEALITKP